MVLSSFEEDGGWDAASWSRQRLVGMFKDSVVDFYPHGMEDERVFPLFEKLGTAWKELLVPTLAYKDVDASRRGTYIQWNLLPEEWAAMEENIGK